MPSKRLIFIDFLRFWAIFLMFWDHALKLFYNFDQNAWGGTIFYQLSINILLITSLSSALFLFLVGFCLVLSHHHRKVNQKDWLFKKFKKGLVLIVLSFLIYFYRYGMGSLFSLPTSGILQLIGTTLIGGSLLMLLPPKKRAFLSGYLLFLILIIDSALRIKRIQIPLLNVYSFPLLPSTFYVLAGLLVSQGYLHWQNLNQKKHCLIWLMAGSAGAVFIFLRLYGPNPFEIFKLYYRISNFRLLSGTLITFNTLLIIFALSILASFEKIIARFGLVKAAAQLGRHALTIYILHVLLGWGISRYLFKNVRFGFGAAVIAVVVFCLLGWGWVKLRQSSFWPSFL